MSNDPWARLARLCDQQRQAATQSAKDAFEAAMDAELRAVESGAPRKGTDATAVDNQRRKHRRRQALETLSAPLLLDAADPWPDIDRQIDLKQALMRMHPVFREMLLMRAFGFTIADVAEVQGAPVGTVKARLHRLGRLAA